VTTGQPRVFIDDRAHQVRHLVIGTLPQGAKSAGGTDDWQVVHIEPRRDFGQLVGHPRAAGYAGDQTAGLFQNPFQHLLSAAHFPQDVDVDRALPARNFVRAADLFDPALDAIGDQFLVPVAPGGALVGLIDDVSVFVVEVRIDRADRADSARCSPGTGTGVVRYRHALAAFHQRPNFAAAIKDRLQPLETHYVPNFPAAELHGLITLGSGLWPCASKAA